MVDCLQIALNFILHWEGGFVDDPQDPGGATKYGISFRFLKTLAPELADVDGDGDIDPDDVFSMSRNAAVAIYKDVFWNGLRLECVPNLIAVGMMDTAVNMGKSRAVKIAQTTVCKAGSRITIDGVVGKQTLGALQVIGADQIFIERFLFERLRHYGRICQANGNLKKFLPGWVNRVNALEQALAGWNMKLVRCDR